MPTKDMTEMTPLQQAIEEQRQERRRERAYFRAPVAAPEHFPPEELRRISGEAKEDFLKRG